MLLRATIIFLLQLTGLALITASGWSYSGENGPDHWKDNYPKCGGESQSPIDIVTKDAVENLEMPEFTLTSDYKNPPAGGTWELSNNGHAIMVAPKSGNYTISNGGLVGVFRLAQFHFHWGSKDTEGSEHTIDDLTFPMEVHFVHYNTKYADLATAVDKSDGLAVLGFFFQLDNKDNPYLSPVTDNLDKVKYEGNVTNISPMSQLSLMQDDVKQFWRYSGSLTTPACYESVTWTVFRNAIPISVEQLEKFRGVYAAEHDGELHHMEDNFRPVQPLNQRKVIANFVNGEGNAAASLNVNTLLISSLVLLVKAIFS